MSGIDDLINSLEKEIGKNDPVQSVKNFIDTGFPMLNKIISGNYAGGLPYGRVVELYGESSSGKTAMATQWMVQTQKLGGVAIFIDWERSFDVNLAKGFGLNDERPFWIYAKPKTWEQGNILAAKACAVIRSSNVIPAEAPILVVFDSVAFAIPQSMSAKEIDEYTMNDTTALARVASTTLKSMAQHAETYNATYLYLNQVRTDPTVIYGSKKKTPGGSAMEFCATVRMEVSRKKIVEKSTKAFIGQTITVKCTKSKLTKPFQECALDFVYDDAGVARFDALGSTLNSMVEEGILKQAGAGWIEWNGQKYRKNDLIKKIEAEGGIEALKKLLV